MFYNICKLIVAAVIKPIFRIKARNADYQPESGAYIICANHISLLDALMIAINIKRPITFMAKAEIFRIRFLRTFLNKIGAVPIKRDGNDSEALMTAIRALKSGNIVMIFPQGTRRRYEVVDPKSFKGGASFMSYFTKAPILPVGIATKNHCVKPFCRNIVNFGSPIGVSEFSSLDRNDFVDKQNEIVSESICNLVEDERNNTFLK